MELLQRPSPSANVRATQSADGAVLIDVRQGIIFSLNVTGSLVWSQLEQGASAQEIAGDLAAKYNISQEQALTDILALVRSLEEKHLVNA